MSWNPCKRHQRPLAQMCNASAILSWQLCHCCMPATFRMAVHVLRAPVAEGLAALHPCVVHRDLKPQNILLDTRGRAKIADFGISRVKVAAPPQDAQAEEQWPRYLPT